MRNGLVTTMIFLLSERHSQFPDILNDYIHQTSWCLIWYDTLTLIWYGSQVKFTNTSLFYHVSCFFCLSKSKSHFWIWAVKFFFSSKKYEVLVTCLLDVVVVVLQTSTSTVILQKTCKFFPINRILLQTETNTGENMGF